MEEREKKGKGGGPNREGRGADDSLKGSLKQSEILPEKRCLKIIMESHGTIDHRREKPTKGGGNKTKTTSQTGEKNCL